ncbi:ribonuclease [Perkinsela sp. CCAP 1560/4]|nr:ribonuclease [Perkinsela sp. CCAP 1560/4]|eukprot:KNH06190.1 ribonuclease [Perkinsela sp. CCAP 1560/4]
MTGISDSLHIENFDDHPQNSLQTKVQVAKKYGLIQLGICLFEDLSSTTSKNCSCPKKYAESGYVVRPFNFFVFPSLDPKLQKFAKTFSIEPGAIAFNKRHNMDFQRWIYDGVGYCNAEHEAAYLSLLRKRVAQEPNMGLSDKHDEEIAHEIIERIDQWMNDDSAVNELKFTGMTSRPIQGYVEGKYRDTNLQFRWKESCLIVCKDPHKCAEKSFNEELVDYVGLREVFKILRESKKPLVGHNVLMDILFLIEAVDRPVPSDTLAVRRQINSTFSTVWDTKVLAIHSEDIESRFEQISLQKLFEDYVLHPRVVAKQQHNVDKGESVMELPGLVFPLGFERYANVFRERRKSKSKATHAHEAAYDALCTGFVFLNLCEELPSSAFEEKINKVALYKNFHALNLKPHGSPFHWLPRGLVLKLTSESTTYSQMAASISPLKGQIQWLERGMAALVLNQKHTFQDAAQHYSSHHPGIFLQAVNQTTEIIPLKSKLKKSVPRE